jgi:uncharacterized membrane protein YqaE (UPF0057 family)
MMNITIDTATIISLVVSVVIPGVSSLLAKQHWPGELIGLLTLALATANGFFTEWAKSPNDYDWKNALLLAVFSYALAVFGRVGIFKDTKLDEKLLAVGSKPTT